MNERLSRFLATGAINTALGLAVIMVAREGLGLGDLAANAAGYAAGLVIGFAMNRNWTFKHTGAILPAFFKFMLLFGVAYAANFAVLIALLRQGMLHTYLPHLAGMVAYTAIFYVGSKHLVFRD